MIRVDEIKGLMGKKGLSGAYLAKAIGVTPQTFYNKMKKGIFDSDEIDVLIAELDIDDPMAVFFAKG